MDGLLDEFIAETRETLAPLAGEIVAWEAAPGDRARLDAIFRFVHTVKGSCGFLELPRLERLSHAAESALADVREGRRPAEATLVSAVLAIIDRVGAMVDALDRGEDYPEGGDEALVLAAECSGEPVAEPILPAADPASVPARSAPRSVRLPVDLLDRMMGGVSDLVLARNALSRLLRDTAADPTARAAFEQLTVSIADLRDAVTRTRMQRIEQLFAGLPRLVRDLAQELGKPVALEMEGADVELDREMIEMIRNPLTHIVRNALDHGIEPAAARAAAGKPATGQLRVTARQAGNQILITVADDGRGVDADRLAAKAAAAGIVSDAEAAAMSHAQRLALMFAPGLSTAGAVTAISGRGVGMDIVRANVERIGGVVEVDSSPGRGTCLMLRVPLTLTIIPALTLTAGGLTFALPRAAIEEIVRIGRLVTVGGSTGATLRDQRLPLASLRALLGVEDAPSPLGIALRAPGGQVFLLGVDQIHDHEELVIRPAAPAVTAAGIYAGTTLSDAGQPMLLLDPAGLAIAAGIRLDQAAPARATAAPEPAAPAVLTLLFRDLDGAERGVRLAMVDRIEDVAAGAIRRTGGRLLLTRQERLVPVAGIADAADGRACRVLMMSDGSADLAYPVDRIIDIVALSGEVAAAAIAGPVLGVTLHDGRQIELLDPFWLFAEAAAAEAPSSAPDRLLPLCLIADDSHWSRAMLRPLIEAAGYRVALLGEAVDGDAALVIATDSEGAAAANSIPLVRLREQREPRDPADTSIWRYDRAALVAALGARAA